MATSTATTIPISGEDVRTALKRVLGEERGQEVWVETCEAIPVARPYSELESEEITRIVDHLKQRSDTASVVGNSMSVKIRTHKHRG